MTYSERLFRQRAGFGCDPTGASEILLITSLALTAAGTTASLEAQSAQAKAQIAEQQNLVTANNKVVNQQVSQLRQQEAQDNESRAREEQKATLANQKAKSTATVAAGEAGVSGNSVNALLDEYNMQLGQFREATGRQGVLTKQGIDAQVEAAKLTGQYTNLQINAPVFGPNYAAAAANFGAEAMGAYRAYNPTAFKGPSSKAIR